jgi:hypothetical protein
MAYGDARQMTRVTANKVFLNMGTRKTVSKCHSYQAPLFLVGNPPLLASVFTLIPFIIFHLFWQWLINKTEFKACA